MKFNQFRLFFFLSSIILLSSCLGTTTVTTTSTDPAFVSLTFAANDSIPYISTAVFTLVDNTIVNLDSLPYQTRIDSVTPTFKFVSTAGAILYYPGGNKYKKDSAWITGTDTIDFNKAKFVRNFASDGKTLSPKYNITVNVHQVDPEVYNWSKVTGDLNQFNATSQKTVVKSDTMFYYSNDGVSAKLNLSTNGYTWNDQSSKLSGLPVNTPLNDMILFNGKIYLTQDGVNIYSSSDGFSWTKKAVTEFTFKSLTYVLNGKLWAVVQSNDLSYRFSSTGDGVTWGVTAGTIPDNFPVKDFAAVSYSSSTGKPKVLVSGGYSATDNVNALKNNWSSEDGVYWVDFSTENQSLDTLAVGGSIISYDNKLFAFGTRRNNGNNYYKVSIDDGLSWQRPDTLRNKLPLDLPLRNYQSVVVFKPSPLKGIQTADKKDQILKSNRIFIIGGISGTTSHSDVWTGKLNRKNFLRQ